MLKVSIFISLLTLSFAQAGHAAGLTAEDCQVLTEVYGVTPAECVSGGVAPAPAAAPAPLPTALGLTSASLPMPAPKPLQVDHVFFREGGSGLDASAKVQLDALARMLESPVMQGVCLRLVGHADGVGGFASNQRLSERRAESVAQYLRERLTQPQRVVYVQGVGSTNFLPGYDVWAPEQRRVALLVRKCTATDLLPQ